MPCPPGRRGREGDRHFGHRPLLLLLPSNKEIEPQKILSGVAASEILTVSDNTALDEPNPRFDPMGAQGGAPVSGTLLTSLDEPTGIGWNWVWRMGW